jgi:hypothetical protein
MKTQTEIHNIVETSSKRLREEKGYAYCAGFFESTLAHALFSLMESNPAEAERFLDRLATFQPNGV